MSSRDHSCLRCGTPIYTPRAACNDCRQTDPVYVRQLVKEANR